MTVHPIQRLAAGVAVTLLGLGLAAVPASADAHRHRRHPGPVLTSTQRACLAQHGISAHRPPNLRSPAGRARLLQALRECGIVGGGSAGTTTTTAPPIIVS